jgi:WD40 repeat protein
VRTLTGHSGWVRSVSYSPDGRYIASGSYDRTIKIWDATTGALVTYAHGA